MVLHRVFIYVLLFAALPLHAEEEEDNGPWTGKVTLGYLATSGNAENSTLNSGFEVGYEVGLWQHLVKAFALNASENDETTAEAYELGWKSERKVSDNNFLFGRADWRHDRFSGYDTQLSQSVGYGRHLIDRDAHKLNAEVGLGARQSDLVDGTEDDELIFRGGANYRWQISETAEFRQDLTLESGEENTYLESVTAVSTQLIGELALVASYTVKNNSNVPANTENTDTYTALSLEYAF